MTMPLTVTKLPPQIADEIARLARVGETPLLVIDLPMVADRFAELARLLPSFDVHYAVKANDAEPIVGLLRDEGAGFEISSVRELCLLRSLGVPLSSVVSSNPVKSPVFIKAAWDAGIRSFAFDSIEEVDKLFAFAPGCDATLRLDVPNFGSEWPLTRKFGVIEEDGLTCLAYARKKGLHACGLAFHVGSQNLRPDAWETALEVASRVWLAALAEGLDMSVLNIGGGFPAPYCREIPPLAEFTSVIDSRVKRLFPRDIKLVTEPGRFLVGEAGTLAASVVAKARRSSERWVYLDIGVFSGLMEAMGGIRYPVVSEREGPCGQWVLAGPSCDSFDVIASDVELPEVEVGDLLFLLSAGAYTTVYGSNFNGFPPPEIQFLR